jgi:hypothetical protein
VAVAPAGVAALLSSGGASTGGAALGGVATIAVGVLISWVGYLTFSGRWTLLVTSRQFPPMPWYFGFLPVFAGPAFLVGGLGELLLATSLTAVRYIGLVLFFAGCAGLLVGIAFGFHLPRRLRPRWYTERAPAAGSGPGVVSRPGVSGPGVSGPAAGSGPGGAAGPGVAAGPAERRLLRRQAERGMKLNRELGQERSSAAPPPDRQVRLIHHLGLSNPRSSEEEAREITGVSRPRLLVNGRISGPLPYATKVSEVPRKGALWVVPGRMLFVQSADEDRRLDESYFVEIPADKLYGMRPGRSDQGHAALELDVDRGTLAFEFDGDIESLLRDVREVLNA